MTSLLGLVEVATSREVRAGFLWRRPRRETYTFADWTVDGIPLRELAGIKGDDRHPNVIGPMADVTYLVENSDEAVPQLDRLLGDATADFPDGRVALLVCAFDWDLACGTLSARIDFTTPDRVLWRELGWQADCDPEIDHIQPPLTVEFEWSNYEQVLKAARDHYSRRTGANIRGATWG